MAAKIGKLYRDNGNKGREFIQVGKSTILRLEGRIDCEYKSTQLLDVKVTKWRGALPKKPFYFLGNISGKDLEKALKADGERFGRLAPVPEGMLRNNITNEVVPFNQTEMDKILSFESARVERVNFGSGRGKINRLYSENGWIAAEINEEQFKEIKKMCGLVKDEKSSRGHTLVYAKPNLIRS